MTTSLMGEASSSLSPPAMAVISESRHRARATNKLALAPLCSLGSKNLVSIFEPVYDLLSNLYQVLNPITIFGPV